MNAERIKRRRLVPCRAGTIDALTDRRADGFADVLTCDGEALLKIRQSVNGLLTFELSVFALKCVRLPGELCAGVEGLRLGLLLSELEAEGELRLLRLTHDVADALNLTPDPRAKLLRPSRD